MLLKDIQLFKFGSKLLYLLETIADNKFVEKTSSVSYFGITA